MAHAVVDLVGVGYKSGSVILGNCEPIFKTISPSLRDSRCNNCFTKIQTLKSCNACRHAHYCSRECQIADWHNGHKLECKMLKIEAFQKFMYEGSHSENKFLLLRIYASLKMKPEVAKKQYTALDGRKVCFDDVHIFIGTDRTRELKIQTCEIMAGFINDVYAESTGVRQDPDQMHPWVCVKCFPILAETETTRIGMGVYVEPAFMYHSCTPTAACVNLGLNLQVRAICDIKAGEHPRICYLRSNHNRLERQTMLKELYDIECDCFKCESNSDADIDYKKLNQMLAQMRQYEKTPVDRVMWPEIYKVHEAILDIFWKIYRPYDERVTEEHKMAYDIAFRAGLHKVQLKRVRNETREGMYYTYGKDHPFYQTFMKSSAHLG